MSSYKKGDTVTVFEGSTIKHKFILDKSVKCLSSLRKYVMLKYPNLDHSKVMVVVN